MRKQEFKRMRRGLGISRTSLNVPTSKSLGCQKEKRKSKEMKTYLKKIMKENFPDLAKEMDFWEAHFPKEAQSPKEVGPKEAHTKGHHNYITEDER